MRVPYPPGTAAAVDYVDSISHDSVSYEYFPNVHITAAQTGPMDNAEHGPVPRACAKVAGQ